MSLSRLQKQKLIDKQQIELEYYKKKKSSDRWGCFEMFIGGVVILLILSWIGGFVYNEVVNQFNHQINTQEQASSIDNDCLIKFVDSATKIKNCDSLYQTFKTCYTNANGDDNGMNQCLSDYKSKDAKLK